MESAPGHGIFAPEALLGSCRRSAESLSYTCPGLFFMLAAVIAVLSVWGNGFPFVCFVPAASILLAGLLLPLNRALARFAFPMLAVLISAWLWDAGRRDVIAETAGRARFAAEAELVVADPSASMQPGEAFRVARITCRVKRFRYGPGGAWVEFDAPYPEVLLDCGSDGPASVPLGYGDCIRVNGYFAPPDKPLLPGGFDYAAYLERDGIHEIFRPATLEVVSRGKGFRRTLYRLRDACLVRICAGFGNAENIRLAGAMLGGRRIALTKETRAGFLSSGTIHILSVSGTHVAIAASLLLFLAAWMPFRSRCLAVLIPLLLYTLSTGMREPAMRAFVMIGVFMSLRAFLIGASRMNSLMLAVYAILLVSPGSLLKPGMHYSFVTVGLFLCLPRDTGAQLYGFLTRARLKNIPAVYMPRRMIRTEIVSCRVLRILTAAAVACLGGGVLSILYQGMFPVSAIPANVLVLPLAYLVFILAVPALAFAWLPPVANVFSVTLEQVFRLIAGTGRFFGGLCETTVPKPSAWTVAVFLAAFFLLLRTRRFRPAVVLVTLMAALFAFWCFRTKFLPPEILVVEGPGAGTEPAVVVTCPELGRADLVNVPDYRLGCDLADWLAARGIESCRVVAVSSGRKGSFGGLDAFSARIPVLDVLCPSNAVAKMPPGPVVTALPRDGAFDRCELSGDLFSFTLGTISGELLSNTGGNGRLTIRRNGVVLRDSALEPGSSYRIHTQPLERTVP